MANFRPEIENPIPLVLLVPVNSNSYGVSKKTFLTIDEALNIKDENGNPIYLFYGSFKTYGGTEREENGVYSIEDTANIETWYRPDIISNCRVGVPATGAVYDILGDPENLNMRNQFLKFKVRRIKGGA